MIKLSIGLVAALALFTSGALACDWHNVQAMASAAPMEHPATTASTNQTLRPLPVVIEQAKADLGQAQCPDGAKDCVPVNQ